MNRLIAWCFLVIAASGLARTDSLSVNASRAVVVEGVIGGGNLNSVGRKLLEYAAQSKDPVDLIINSPGGDVLTGKLFISYMERLRNQGVAIRCFVPQMAASMAFSILTHCDERYALSNSFLLWHRVRASGMESMTGPQAHELARDLLLLDQEVIDELNATLGMDEEEILYHFNRETLHTATQLAVIAPEFIVVRPAIDGLLEVMLNKKVPRNEQPMRFFGKYVYIQRTSPSVTK